MAPVKRGTFVSIAEDSGSSSDDDDAPVAAKRPKLDPSTSSNFRQRSRSDSSSTDDSSDSESNSSSSGEVTGGKPAPAQTTQLASPAEESSDESSDSDDEEDGVISQLKDFLTSSERVLTLKGTSAFDRKLVHSWIETHKDATVRSFGHVAKLVGAERVMTITKSDEYVGTAAGATKPTAKGENDGSSDSDSSDDSDDSDSDESDSDDSDSDAGSDVNPAPETASDIESSSDTDSDSDSAENHSGNNSPEESRDDTSVVSKLERFAKSSENVFTITGTTGPERAAIHKWVETHADPAVREWGHVSKTVGPDRLMTVTKTGASVAAARPKSKSASVAAASKPASAGADSDDDDPSDSSDDSSGEDDSDDSSEAEDDGSNNSPEESRDDTSVVSKLERFAKSSENVFTITGTTGPERAAIHKWVETHADPAVREWGHVSKTVGPDRLMTVTKTGASVAAARPKSKSASVAAASKPASAGADSDDSGDDSDSDDSSGNSGDSSENEQYPEKDDNPDDNLQGLLKRAEAAKMEAFNANKFDALPGLQAEIDRINGRRVDEVKRKLAIAEAAKVTAFNANDFAALPNLQKQVDGLTIMLKLLPVPPATNTKPGPAKNRSSISIASSHTVSTDDSSSDSDDDASASGKSSTDDASSESDDDEDASVISRLKRFYKSSEQVLIFEDTTAPDRSAVHEWVEGHDDPIVRGWGHTSKTVGTTRVMTVSKNPEDALGTSDVGQKKRREPKASAMDRAPKKSRADGNQSSGDGETVKRFENGKHILFVGQLPYDATAAQIQGHFQTDAAGEIMGGHLDIIGVRLLTDKTTGKSRGMAFVDCGSEEDLERGVHMHQSKLLGRRINVEKSASGGGKTDRRKRFIEKSKSEYEEIRHSRVAEALESRLRRSDHELSEDDVDEEIRGFLLSVPVHIAVEALDEFHTAVIKTPPTSRRAYLMGVLKRLHNETDSTMPLNKRRGHDRKKGGGAGGRGGGRGASRGGARGRGSSSFASGGIGGAFGASGRGRGGGSGRGGGARGSKW